MTVDWYLYTLVLLPFVYKSERDQVLSIIIFKAISF